MMQSEFFERTHITLTAEEYADVECLYNAVKMDKDKFCKHWVSERKNPLFKELAEAYCHEYRMHVADTSQMHATCESLRKESDEYRASMEKVLENTAKKCAEDMESFAQQIVLANEEGDLRVYDVVEEEYGIGFIIKTKHEAGIPLSEEEIRYMVGKL